RDLGLPGAPGGDRGLLAGASLLDRFAFGGAVIIRHAGLLVVVSGIRTGDGVLIPVELEPVRPVAGPGLRAADEPGTTKGRAAGIEHRGLVLVHFERVLAVLGLDEDTAVLCFTRR